MTGKTISMNIIKILVISAASVLLACSVERPVGLYADCINRTGQCPGSICLLSDLDYSSGYGMCTHVCADETECWPSNTGHIAACVFFDDYQRSYCALECTEEDCPDGMACHEGICTHASDGCGPWAHPTGSGCASDAPTPTPAGAGSGCCRRCTSGKPCGDACIASNKTCHQGAGCAC